MPVEGEYEPGTWKLAVDQVQLYEESGGTEGLVLNGAPCVILWSRGRKSAKVRKNPVVRVNDGDRYEAPVEAKRHQLVYLMEGNGVITLNGKDYPVRKGAGVYLGASETAAVRPDGQGTLKLFHLVVPEVKD